MRRKVRLRVLVATAHATKHTREFQTTGTRVQVLVKRQELGTDEHSGLDSGKDVVVGALHDLPAEVEAITVLPATL